MQTKAENSTKIGPVQVMMNYYYWIMNIDWTSSSNTCTGSKTNCTKVKIELQHIRTMGGDDEYSMV